MFVKRLISWVASWGGALGTGKGQQIGLPVEPILDTSKAVPVDAALQISSVYACVELLANTISTLPLFVYRFDQKSGAREPDRGSRLWMLLHERPNNWMTPSEFMSVMVLNRLLRGNAYAHIIRDKQGDPVALVPLSADQMEVSRAAGSEVYIYYEDGLISVLAPENVIHWKGIGNGYIGLAKIEYMRATLDEAVKTQENAASLFGKGSKPTGVLQTDSKLNAEQMAALMQRFGTQMTSKTGGLLIADRGLKYTQLSLSPADTELLSTRKFGVEEICRWFGVPSVLVGASGQTTWGSGIAEIVAGFHKFTVSPLCAAFEQALERRLVPFGDESTTIEFKMDAFLRSDAKTRAEYYSTMVQNGVMSRNEVRHLENLPPVDSGDALTAQSNLMPLEKLGTQTNSQAGSSPADGSNVRQ